jgi:glycosyltransferase involved in cell wall biosynthesis
MNSAQRNLKILQVSTSDILGGGAEKVAWNLFRAYLQRGHDSWLAVGRKWSDDPRVLLIPNEEHHRPWTRMWRKVQCRLQRLGIRGVPRVAGWLALLGERKRLLDKCQGVEDFHFPGTASLLECPPYRPDVLHAHNLHGEYFDLRLLPWLSREVPVVLTLHDAWLLSGHCAHSFDCERWRAGCGQCPDLTIYPAVRRDNTAYNWQRKRGIVQRSRLYVSTPCQWLMEKVKQSLVKAEEYRVIPHGVDLTVFTAGDRLVARNRLGLPTDAAVILFVSNLVKRNMWRDYATMETAIQTLAARQEKRRVIFVCLGEERRPEWIGQAELRFIGHETNSIAVASFYRAADVYMHAARADTFPNVILEALACGTPVVATSVGGIPEQIEEGVTGFLTPPGDARAMAARVEQLLSDNALRQRFAVAAVESARRRFDLNRQVCDYLAWYRNLAAYGRPRAVAAVGCEGGHA